MGTSGAVAPPELWGTFSPADHLRPRAFVADVLIYDKIVVPVPPTDDESIRRKWEKRWNPDRQRELLGIIKKANPGSVLEVEWSSVHEHAWHSFEDHEGRLALANSVSSDVSNIREAKVADPDSAGQWAERRYLADAVRPSRDTEIRGAVPVSQVQVVAAYESQRRFRRDVPITVGNPASTDRTLLSAFAWPLVVPSDARRSDTDLLKQAMDLASRKEWRAYRAAFHRWRADLPSGTTPDEARRNLEEIIGLYKAARRKTKLKTSVRVVGLIVVAGAAATGAALGMPFEAGAITAGGTGVSMLLEARMAHTSIPEPLMSGALFHEARKRFGWD